MESHGPAVRDVSEREIAGPVDFSFSDVPPTAAGFPAPRRRWIPSTAPTPPTLLTPPTLRPPPPPQLPTQSRPPPQPNPGGRDDAIDPTRDSPPNEGRPRAGAPSLSPEDRRQIDRENQARLDSMSPQEIAQAQKELLAGLNPSLVRRLLLRSAAVDIDAGPSSFDTVPSPFDAAPAAPPPSIEVQDTSSCPPEQPQEPRGSQEPHGPQGPHGPQERREEEAPPPFHPPPHPLPTTLPSVVEASTSGPGAPPLRPAPAEQLFRASDPPPTRTHFPAAPPPPDLDPNDPDFFHSLHQKYFPNLPADPSKLAWMAPLPSQNSAADQTSPYFPGRRTVAISALRFDFTGTLVSPSRARQIPVSRGLHHHSDAPEAAGYTIRELALLARSAFPAQRCIAFRVLGRILYRLGRGEWGAGIRNPGGGNDNNDGTNNTNDDDELALGLWDEIKQGQVIGTLTDAATVEYGHRGSMAFATEALWLYEKGGWKTKSVGR